MNSRTKSAIVLLGTLVLGIAIGAMLWTAAHNRRMEEIRSLRRQGALAQVIESVVQPVDETQKGLVYKIVSRYESGLSEMYKEMASARREATDSLRFYLGDILSEDQVARLDQWLRENRRSSRSRSERDSTAAKSR